jgi:hypothetical protein
MMGSNPSNPLPGGSGGERTNGRRTRVEMITVATDRGREDVLSERRLGIELGSPDGCGPSAQAARRTTRLLVPLATVGLIGGAIVLYRLGGWAAVGVGLMLFAVYYSIGWGAELVAAYLRMREKPHAGRRLSGTADATGPPAKARASGPAPAGRRALARNHPSR